MQRVLLHWLMQPDSNCTSAFALSRSIGPLILKKAIAWNGYSMTVYLAVM